MSIDDGEGVRHAELHHGEDRGTTQAAGAYLPRSNGAAIRASPTPVQEISEKRTATGDAHDVTLQALGVTQLPLKALACWKERLSAGSSSTCSCRILCVYFYLPEIAGKTEVTNV